MRRMLIISLIWLTACSTVNIHRSSKQEIKLFLKDCSKAFEAGDENWFKRHCSNDVFQQFNLENNAFSDTVLLEEMKIRFLQKPHFQSQINEKLSIGLGKYSEITGYRGGGVLIQKKDDRWIILKYRYHGK